MNVDEKNNQVVVSGRINTDFVYSHETLGEKFFSTSIESKRLSGKDDIVPLTVSERLIDIQNTAVGTVIEVTGQFRSHNHKDGNKSRLLLSVFALNVTILEPPATGNINHVELNGYVCKAPVYRKTPLGREVSDVLLAVNRAYGKSDYLPCLLWGRNAMFAQNLDVGSKVRFIGRIQSREYIKKITENTCENKRAYEVSVSNFEMID